jgi:hypothetical protein
LSGEQLDTELSELLASGHRLVGVAEGTRAGIYENYVDILFVVDPLKQLLELRPAVDRRTRAARFGVLADDVEIVLLGVSLTGLALSGDRVAVLLVLGAGLCLPGGRHAIVGDRSASLSDSHAQGLLRAIFSGPPLPGAGVRWICRGSETTLFLP